MLNYYEIERWSKMQRKIDNRCSIINQLLGASWDGDPNRSLRVRYMSGSYVARLCDADFASWRPYDEASTTAAFVKLDALCDGLWHALRSGTLSLAVTS